MMPNPVIATKTIKNNTAIGYQLSARCSEAAEARYCIDRTGAAPCRRVLDRHANTLDPNSDPSAQMAVGSD